MNPTFRAHAAFFVTLAAFSVLVLAGLSAFAPSSVRPTLDALAPRLGAPAYSSPDVAPSAPEQPPRPGIELRQRPPTAADQRSLDSTPAMAVAPSPPAVIESSPPAQVSTQSQANDTAEGDVEVANTAHDGPPVEVEITISNLPDPPDVAASHTTATVEVSPAQSERDDPWAPVRQCESGGNYGINTGNGFYGAYQFTISSWNWVAGQIGRQDLVGVRPDRADRADQDALAQALAFEIGGGGLHHWPVCGRQYAG